MRLALGALGLVAFLAGWCVLGSQVEGLFP